MSSYSANQDFEVNIGQYFSRGWEIFKQYAWAFVAYTVLIGIIAGLLSLLPSPLGMRSSGEGMSGGGNLIFSILSPILSAGFYIVAFQIARNRPMNFSDFFHGFNKFLPLFLTALVSGLLIGLGFILLIIPGIYLAVAYMFAQPFVIDKNLGFWEAMETSRKLITKKWFSFFGLGLLISLLNLAGLLILGIGLLVTAPLSACIVAAAYEDIVGLNSVAEGSI